MAAFGIVEAAQRARAWGPDLETPGQRLILAALVLHTGADSVSDPSVGQLAAYTGFAPRSVRRLLSELQERDIIAPLNERVGGRSKQTKWTIKPGPGSPPLGTDDDEKPGPPRQKPGPGSPKTRTGESASESSEIPEQRDCESEGHEWVRVAKSVARCRHCKESTR